MTTTNQAFNLPERHQTILEKELVDGESIVWAGQPSAKALANSNAISVIAVLVCAVCLAVPMGSMSLIAYPSLKYLLIVVIVLIAGAAVAFLFLSSAQTSKRTIYAVTTDRAIIISVNKSMEVESFYPSDFSRISADGSADGLGHVYFALEIVQQKNGTYEKPIGFVGIFDPLEVADLIKDIPRSTSSNLKSFDRQIVTKETNDTIGPNVRRTVLSILEPGESVIWSDQPLPGRLARKTLPLSLFGLLLAIMSTIFITASKDLLTDIAPGLFGILGLLLILTPALAYRKAKNTVYVVTDSRAIFLIANKLRSAKSYYQADLGDINRTEYTDGSGDVLFVRPAKSSTGVVSSFGFFASRDPHGAEAAVRTLHGTIGWLPPNSGNGGRGSRIVK